MKFNYTLLILLATLALGVSCVPTRHLAPNERLLFKVKLEGVEQNAPENIISLYQQKPNRRVLGSTPYLSIYYFGKKFYNPQKIEKRIEDKRARADKRIAAAGDDSSKVDRLVLKKERQLARLSRRLKEGNALMALGEPPTIYDSVLTANTLKQIQTYLYSKGFFKSKVAYTTTEKHTKITLTFQVAENTPTTYSHITDSIPDPAIKAIYDSTRSQSFIQLNQNYDEQLLVNERNRIENLLKNSGYFQFKKQFIVAEVDTSFEENKVRLRIMINNDNAGNPHQVFRLNRVNFIADASYQRFGLKRDTILYNTVHYLAYEHKISPRILDKKIVIRPGQRYNLNNTISTERQLTNLDMYRFINITYAPADTSDNNLLTANISASPSKRFQETTEAGLTYSAQLPGPFSNFRLLVRNVFRGAEVLEIGLRGGLEGQFSIVNTGTTPSARLTMELGSNVAFVFPQFLVPFNANRYFSRYNPRTRLNVGYTHINRQEFIRTNLETTFDYIWQRSSQLQYVFTPVDISIISSKIDPGFQEQVFDALTKQNGGQKTTYEKSFTPSVVSSINFSRLSNTNNYNHTLDAHYFRLFVEQAGLVTRTLLNLPDSLGNLKLYRYGRLNSDYRRYFKLDRTSFLVTRLNFGVARAFEKGDEFLPYDKYFYAGGGTSVRAFQPRRLGPGSYKAPGFVTISGTDTSRVFYNEQQGELLMEGNIEYRFKIYGFINGAVFTDVGNIWMLSEDPSRPGSQFKFNSFYKEFAVGSGFGLRFDFNFLIARLDIATKVYDPARKSIVVGDRNLNTFLSREKTTFNLGIGYPF